MTQDWSPPQSVRARALSLLLHPTAPPLWLGIAVATALIVAETAIVFLLRRIAPESTFGAVFLLGVLVISASWGFGLAVTTTVASAIVYAYFHLDLDGGLIPKTPQDAMAVAIFVPIALLANVLVGQARLRAAEAQANAAKVSKLAQQQAALRHVATLVAGGAPLSDVFTEVSEEIARSLNLHSAGLFRFDPDGCAVLVAAHDSSGRNFLPVGTRLSLEGDNVAALVRHTGGAARMDSHDDATGSAAARVRELGLRSGVGAPIQVNGRLWGAAIVGSSLPQPPPPDTEARMADFADLVATAVSNAEARTQLKASRTRIVTAADDARRRIERDLHDGAQQRLVSLGLMLRAAEDSIPPGLDGVKQQLSDVVSSLVGVSEELQSISRGIHPAILSKGGLGPALKTLARRSAVPVELHANVEGRLPETVEVATYYVVAEALTNVAKHAQASTVAVTAEAGADSIRLSIRDDGLGGADSRKGSGILGLSDRVEALGGQLSVTSPAGDGTTLLVTIPYKVE
jgi:signal transduction histidine kinase